VKSTLKSNHYHNKSGSFSRLFGNAVQIAFSQVLNFFFLLKMKFFFMFSYRFDVLMSKIIFKKIKTLF
jgi:hypothetical protein